ncbi:glucokinase regulatory protein [Danio aesculapii]|uniref:glucokinase regulatory protein n=1 Tax=Danio aesculapii TaxID=1142201 RepID=UPI0024C07470|nr:glucokinase regulatory protein [Danio aesculapii]
MDQSESCYELGLPVMEKSNPISRGIDRANTKHILHVLKQCDAEIFQKDIKLDTLYQRLYSVPVIQTMVDVAKRVELMLRNPEDNLIVLSGCGTSGRTAFLLATSYNEMLKRRKQKQMCLYIIAGGDRALLTSQEAPEDDPALGAHMLDKACAGKKHVLFIGISCGISAPFVAGQLDFCLNHLDVFTPVLLGFNPVHMARTEPMQGCTFHFKDVAERMIAEQRREKAFILNPVLGAEAISGSSRMKGGSATKIILETVLMAGHDAAFKEKIITPECTSAWITASEMAYETTYSHSDELAALIQKAGESLQMKAHVYYLGWQTLGIIGMTDASECMPTFGADFGDIRGFINNGFSEMRNKEGDLSSLGPEFIISHRDFVETVLPGLSQNDMILFLFTVNDDLHEVMELANRVRRRTSNLHAIAHDLEKFTVPEEVCSVFETVLNITWSFSSEENPVVMRQRWELSTKWCLNAISTGAHVLKGKVYVNYMIDLRVTNSKLYRRAISILQRFSGSSRTDCEKTLLKVIYSTDDLTEDTTQADVHKHTDAANRRDRVVPTALLMLQCGCTLAEAQDHLEGHPVIRDAVSACFNSSKNNSTAD